MASLSSLDDAAETQSLPSSIAAALLDGLLDDLVVDMCFAEHLTAKRPLYALDGIDGVDIFGQRPARTTERSFKCEHCKRPIGVNKYAPHLEKCMGKGRGARTARRTSKPLPIEFTAYADVPGVARQWDDENDTSVEEHEYFAATNARATADAKVAMTRNGNGHSSAATQPVIDNRKRKTAAMLGDSSASSSSSMMTASIITQTPINGDSHNNSASIATIVAAAMSAAAATGRGKRAKPKTSKRSS